MGMPGCRMSVACVLFLAGMVAAFSVTRKHERGREVADLVKIMLER